jgi:hypothetical protein
VKDAALSHIFKSAEFGSITLLSGGYELDGENVTKAE